MFHLSTQLAWNIYTYILTFFNVRTEFYNYISSAYSITRRQFIINTIYECYKLKVLYSKQSKHDIKIFMSFLGCIFSMTIINMAYTCLGRDIFLTPLRTGNFGEIYELKFDER